MKDNRNKTCCLDLTETIESGNGVLLRYWECSECGRTHEEVEGEYEYCPHCGAQVIQYSSPSVEAKSPTPYFPPL